MRTFKEDFVNSRLVRGKSMGAGIATGVGTGVGLFLEIWRGKRMIAIMPFVKLNGVITRMGGQSTTRVIKRYLSDVTITPEDNKSDTAITPEDNKRDIVIASEDNKRDLESLKEEIRGEYNEEVGVIIPEDHKQNTDIVITPEDHKQDTDIVITPEDHKQDAVITPEDHKQDTDIVIT